MRAVHRTISVHRLGLISIQLTDPLAAVATRNYVFSSIDVLRLSAISAKK